MMKNMAMADVTLYIVKSGTMDLFYGYPQYLRGYGAAHCFVVPVFLAARGMLPGGCLSDVRRGVRDDTSGDPEIVDGCSDGRCEEQILHPFPYQFLWHRPDRGSPVLPPSES